MTNEKSEDRYAQLRHQWMDDAQDQTFDTLPAFLAKMCQEQTTEYQEKCLLMAATARGVITAMCRHFGLKSSSDFASVVWVLAREALAYGSSLPVDFISYEELLYPQYESKFEEKRKHLRLNDWKQLRQTAIELLQKDDERKNGSFPFTAACPEVRKHWEAVADGYVPFGFTVWDERSRMHTNYLRL